MRTLQILAGCAMLFLGMSASAQTESTGQTRKGSWYVYWGWNRAGYSTSDITFKGPDYRFTLGGVIAKDSPTNFSLNTYLNPARFTIPQYNFRLGYYVSNNYNISFGIDHMKYVVQQHQHVTINGSIASQTDYDGFYENDDIEITSGFLEYEHTDGLNFPNLEIRHMDDLVNFGKVRLGFTEGVGLGMLIPRTNSTLLDHPRNDKFHVAGYGFSAMLGFNATFFDRFFLQSELKGGYLTMPDVRTTSSGADKASQEFYFGQINLVFGMYFHTGAKHRKTSGHG